MYVKGGVYVGCVGCICTLSGLAFRVVISMRSPATMPVLSDKRWAMGRARISRDLCERGKGRRCAKNCSEGSVSVNYSSDREREDKEGGVAHHGTEIT